VGFSGWLWSLDADTLDDLLRGAQADPPQIGFANDAALLPMQQRLLDRLAATENGDVRLDQFGPVELAVTRRGFAPDYFVWGGISFASAALRQVLALSPDVIEYYPVNADRSRPDVIARDYRIMHPVAVRPLIDLQHTPHERLPVQRSDGSIADAILLTPERRQYWRNDFVADVPLFRAAHSHAIVAEDTLAERILAAGMTGVVFQDITSDRAQREFVLKKVAAAG
jgi:hypothetical protein